MAILNSVFSFLFGENTRKTIEIFRENAEAKAERDEARIGAALSQFATEFQVENRSGFDRLMDGLNRLPRPAMAMGVIGLFVSAMVDPDWFISRMQGLAHVPEPLWWLMGAIVSFLFWRTSSRKKYRVSGKTGKFYNATHSTFCQNVK